jgi:hypothetical protein
MNKGQFAYLELYHYEQDNYEGGFFYIGQGGKSRVEVCTANGGQPLYRHQARAKVFSIPIHPLLVEEFNRTLRSSSKFGKSAYFGGISKAQTEIGRIYESFFFDSFRELCEAITASNPSLTTDFNFSSALKIDTYREDEMGARVSYPEGRWAYKQVQPSASLSCANGAPFTPVPTEANEYKKYFLDEFFKISDQIKSTLLKFFVDKGIKIQ